MYLSVWYYNYLFVDILRYSTVEIITRKDNYIMIKLSSLKCIVFDRFMVIVYDDLSGDGCNVTPSTYLSDLFVNDTIIKLKPCLIGHFTVDFEGFTNEKSA